LTVLLVLLGGAVGAPLRYLTDRWVQARHDSLLPWGTLAVNVAGSLVLGVVAAAVHAGAWPGWVLAGVGVGLCGALTTFSTFGYETLRLVEDGAALEALGNVALSLVAAFGACVLGWAGTMWLL
jgi:CrcB protein